MLGGNGHCVFAARAHNEIYLAQVVFIVRDLHRHQICSSLDIRRYWIAFLLLSTKMFVALKLTYFMIKTSWSIWLEYSLVNHNKHSIYIFISVTQCGPMDLPYWLTWEDQHGRPSSQSWKFYRSTFLHPSTRHLLSSRTTSGKSNALL